MWSSSVRGEERLVHHLAQDVADQDVNLLNTRRDPGRNADEVSAQIPHGPLPSADEAHCDQAAHASGAQPLQHVRGAAGGAESDGHVAASAQRLDLTSEDATEIQIVTD